jgi:hypothetical protein
MLVLPSDRMLVLPSAKILLASCVLLSITNCGVKGDPLPPKVPMEVGRGQPTYHKASEKIPLQKYQPNEDEMKDEKEPEDE